nr:MAG TPA: hypothetical protein [Bacteriophage sp.]
MSSPGSTGVARDPRHSVAGQQIMPRASPARLCRIRSNDPQLGVENKCR